MSMAQNPSQHSMKRNPAPQRPTDTAEQSEVVMAGANDDVLVVAGAGSGKTYTMTRRIVELIKRGVPAQRILGLTFTKKAAAQLLAKVSAAVESQRLSNDPDAAFLKPSVYTYDAFFQSIVRQYGLLVGMDQSTQPLTDAGAYQLAADTVGSCMNDIVAELGTESDFSTVVREVLFLTDACNAAMISERCPDFASAATQVRAWDDAFIAHIDNLTADFTMPEKLPTDKECQIPKRRKKDSDETYKQRMADMQRNREIRAAGVVRNLRDVAHRRNVLLHMAERYQQAKHDANMAEFSDFTVAAFQLVTRFPSIGAQYRSRFTHVFLDEYQDTSTTQAALIAALFHPEQGTSSAVNAVGDPFQSIYAWRGASPGAFKQFQNAFRMSGQPRSLTQTRRNPSIVLEAANDLTIPLRTQPRRRSSALQNEVGVKPLQPLETADRGTLMLAGYRWADQEIDGVVRFVKQAVKRYGKPDADGIDRKAPHVAVLFRSKTHMGEYRDACEEAGLACQIVGYSALFDRPEIVDLFAVMHIVADHSDSASLMRLLASPRYAVGPQDLRVLASMAERMNEERQYRALVEAGLVPEGLTDDELSAAVREHRDQTRGGVFLLDLLFDDDIAAILADEPRLSDSGKQAIGRCAKMLSFVQSHATAPVRDAVHACIEALDLDIDMIVAHNIAKTITNASTAVSDTTSAGSLHAALTSIEELSDSYMSELQPGHVGTLRGFVAWLDAMRQSPDEPAIGATNHADVVLMTVHQAKGLEWDAVAVVGLKKGGFPSNRGDGLAVTAQGSGELSAPMPDAPYGVWTPPEYVETAKTWLYNARAVPVPVRADASILPRFPHDVSLAQDPLHAFDDMDCMQLAEESQGLYRHFAQADGIETDSDFLTQEEEYGRRLHADERRLAYVALTRAKHDALLTYAEKGQETEQTKSSAIIDEASVFFAEIWDIFRKRPDAIVDMQEDSQHIRSDVQSDADAAQSDNESSEHDRPAARPHPIACFIGDAAAEYHRAIVDDALEADRLYGDSAKESANDSADILWPRSLDTHIAQALNDSAELARTAHISDNDDGEFAQRHPDGLTAHAIRVLNDVAGRFGVGDLGEHTDISLLRTVGVRVAQQKAQSVTALQARAGNMDERKERDYWRSLVRPIPRVASAQAQAGTRLHDWAARFIMGERALGSGQDDAAFSESFESRADLLAKLDASSEEQHERQERHGDLPQSEQTITQWCRRLSASVWARRDPVWAERQIVAYLPGLHVVTGKLDAVFRGGLDENDPTKTYTVIDWKTGKRPRRSDDIAHKLVQLDMYRLLLSKMEGVPLESIDAALYYLSETDEARREVRAEQKTEEEILAELSSGIPEQSDND